ncbi:MULTISPECIES: 2OG-Fe dioxygenase family protein [unclassified Pseudomonas]|uniref:2OG-Fe dioxygenase family protein n=1 Tax=unclassified Pseudomonas TaxID=196821 RepID=UPI001A9CD054|nr:MULTISPECIES: 2OG-Fe dioxygenase family protein [unclassified Pseudomonas]
MEISRLYERLTQHHYCHEPDFNELIRIAPGDRETFQAYWANLMRDDAFKDYTHRERRILRYRLLPSGQLQMDRNAEYTSSVVYPVNYRQGTNALSYAEEGFIAHPVLQQLLAADIALIGPRLKNHIWSIDIHQFRVKADNALSSPTTSGIHQDGLDWVFMHFIDAQNTMAVVSEVFASQAAESCLLRVPMVQFLETIVIDDSLVYHRAGDVRQVAGQHPAWRDLLLVGFRRLPTNEEASSPC